MTRKSTSMTLDDTVLAEARRLGVNLSKAAENGIRSAIAEEHARLWKEENASAIAAYNAMIDENGVVFSNRRKF